MYEGSMLARDEGMNVVGSNGVVIVTGGTSGIGKAITLRLLESGARVAACYAHSASEADALRDECAGYGDALSIVKADVSSEQQVGAWATLVIQRFGKVSGLVNNAGVFETAPLLESDVSHWDRVLDTNLKGPFLCTRAFAPQILLSGAPGRIVNVASVLACRPLPGRGAYSAAKAGLLALTQAWAVELAAHRITVNAVLPGTIDTRITREWMGDPAYRAALESPIPLGRVGLADEVAAAVLFLLSDAAAYITGAQLSVDGGLGVSPRQQPDDDFEGSLVRHA